MIDWPQFTPWSALAGGSLIGLSAVLLILALGRIAGISGIVSALIPRWGSAVVQDEPQSWRWAFVLGLIAPSVALTLLNMPIPIQVTSSVPLLIIAGLLVGIGTIWASGCTSGHGVCGLSRLSPRSLMATLSFMGAGFITVGLVRTFFAG